MKKTVGLVVTTMLLAFVSASFAQKKPLDHSVYDTWNDMVRPRISLRGDLISYEINPQDGDGALYVTNKSQNFKKSFERGARAQLDPSGKFVVLKIVPTKSEVRDAKLAKKKPDQMPKDSGGVYILASDEWIGFSKVKNFAMGEKNGSWVGFLTDYTAEQPKDSVVNNSAKTKPKAKSKGKSAKKETQLTLFDTESKQSKEFIYVSDYQFAEQGNYIAISQITADTLEQTQLSIFDTKSAQVTELLRSKGEINNLIFSKDGKMLAFHFSADTGKVKIYDLYLWSEGSTAKMIVDSNTPELPSQWVVSHHSSPRFSDDGKRLFLYSYPRPQDEPKDTLTSDEKVIFDLWSWTDTLLQTQQKVNLKRDQKKSYLGVYNLKKRKYTQLADKSMESVRLSKTANGKYAIGVDRTPYLWSMTWDYPSGSDYYLVEIETGERKPIAKNRSSFPSLSHNDKYLAYYQFSDSIWYGMSTKDLKAVPLTASIKTSFFDELNDTPSEPRPYGSAGWLTKGNDVLIYDRYDIWQFDLTGKNKPKSLTNHQGASSKVSYRYQYLDTDAESIPDDVPILVSLFDETDKQSGYATITANTESNPKTLIKEPYRFSVSANTQDLSTLLYTKQSYQQYPDLWVSNASFGETKKLTHANPQQDNYLWGSAELVTWYDFNRNEVEGLLYLPENFDATKKYPMMLYFYERHSDGLHTHYKPYPGRSVICPTLYVSNDYIVFMPNISYTEGLPGKNAYDAIISGTMAMVSKGFVDIDKIGVQGQSWGGYQIAYLVTQTDLFKAASAGAPVSNMTSAYGAIRWGSGLSRMFQYERTQSRIGATLWERPLHYIENSPLFFAPRVNTPLLIRHDDADEAVPWYQGIELFLALRRLDKPVWMINYNDEPHNLVRRANRIDWAIRMQQYFDHYLKGTPAPKWLIYGVPAIQKGQMGYELIE